MDLAGTTKVMQVVVTPKETMAMEVVIVSSLKPHFVGFFSSNFLSDGSQDQGSQGQQTGCTYIFFSYLSFFL